ncbi:hypothetical protein [Motilibacter deserti]|uniref:Uncharacterized protein n=1 Tax=Motilibacter deserti TaxID=2714956 RepID=A0ABX0GU92_9ACTN|nr:hypothetical protein [Motilibacter deserti]NHC13276.1 hypothetical protein [Motilibacter deserti]
MVTMTIFAPSVARDVLPLNVAFWRTGPSVLECRVPSASSAWRGPVAFLGDVCLSPTVDGLGVRLAVAADVDVAGDVAVAVRRAAASVVRVAAAAVVAPAAAQRDEQASAVAAAAAIEAVNTAGMAKKQAHTYARPRVSGSRAWSPPV